MLSVPILILFLKICVFIVGVLLLIKVASIQQKRPEGRWLVLFVTSVCVISFFGLNVYIQESLESKEAFSRLRYVGHAIIAQAWFYFLTVAFSGRHILCKPWVIAISFAPSLVTVIFSIVPGLGDLLTTNYKLFLWQGAKVVSFNGGPWFMAHILWAYLFGISGVIYSLYMLTKLKGNKLRQLIILSISGFVGLFIDIYCVVTDSPLRWAMLSGGTFLLIESAILYAIIKHGLLDIPTIAKDQIFRLHPDPILILDENNQLKDFNKAALHTFNLSSKHIHQNIHTIKIFKNIDINKMLANWNFSKKNRGERHFEVNIDRLNSRGLPHGKILSFHELTLQKQIEKKLNNHIEFKSNLLTMITHDFSNVIQTQTAISSNLEKEVGPELRTLARSLVSSTFSSKELMTNILLWTRLQKNTFQPVRTSLEMNCLIKETIEGIDFIWAEKGIDVKLESKQPTLIYQADGFMIESILRNLMTNCIRASSPGQKITIFLDKNDKEIIIKVIDQGSGIDLKKLEVINNSTDNNFSAINIKSEGFGLGLTFVKKFVALHNGTLKFESLKQKGTTATLRLPF
ncbi:MAG: ATP-binding protein [Bdellovibrionales bacterium]|nr:ATP-binding protein [Bdellovibrionales bacterium]